MLAPNISQQYVSEYRRELGNQINEARLKAKITEADLAEAVGLSEKSIIKLEAGRFSFNIDVYVKVAITLNLKIALR